jgi:plastocyanin
MTDRSRESLLLPILIPVGALVAIGLVLFGFSRVLLSLKPAAATATALVAAVGIMGVAAFVASRRRVTSGTLGAFVGAVAGIAMLAGGIAIAVIGPPEGEGPPGFHAVLAAPEGAATKGFSTDRLSVPPGKPIDLEFDNDDPGVGHNVVIFDGPDDAAPVVFQGQVITGPTKATYPVKPLAAGDYFFHCEIHPTTMTGTLKVEEGPKLVAQNTAFEEKELKLPADTPSTLTFENKDPFEHNVSIYEDSSASGEPLFTVTPFPGPATKTFDVPPMPAGEYYFHCDIHPVMNGTVVVSGKPPGEGGPGDGGGGGGEPPGGGGG